VKGRGLSYRLAAEAQRVGRKSAAVANTEEDAAGGGGAGVGHPYASALGDRRSARALAQQPGVARRPASRRLNGFDKSPSSGDCEVAVERAFSSTGALSSARRWQHPIQMKNPIAPGGLFQISTMGRRPMCSQFVQTRFAAEGFCIRHRFGTLESGVNGDVVGSRFQL